MGWYIDVSSYRNTQESDTGIDTIFNVLMYQASQYIDMDITYIIVFVIQFENVGACFQSNYWVNIDTE